MTTQNRQKSNAKKQKQKPSWNSKQVISRMLVVNIFEHGLIVDYFPTIAIIIILIIGHCLQSLVKCHQS